MWISETSQSFNKLINFLLFLNFFPQLSSFFSFMLDNFTQLNGNGPGEESEYSYPYKM